MPPGIIVFFFFNNAKCCNLGHSFIFLRPSGGHGPPVPSFRPPMETIPEYTSSFQIQQQYRLSSCITDPMKSTCCDTIAPLSMALSNVRNRNTSFMTTYTKFSTFRRTMLPWTYSLSLILQVKAKSSTGGRREAHLRPKWSSSKLYHAEEVAACSPCNHDT